MINTRDNATNLKPKDISLFSKSMIFFSKV